MKAEEEECLVEDASQEAKEYENLQLKIEERVHLAFEARGRAEEEDSGLNAE